jgi:hypothetical protein
VKKLQSIAANQIKAYCSARAPEANLFVRIELDGKINTLPVYRIPIELLRYNIRNGRFASELKAKEKQLGRNVDSRKPADAKIIQQLLLGQNPSETALLKEDLAKHEQVDPGIVTHDGAVINANRRMSVISQLFDETNEPKWKYLKAAILPDSVTEQDLWRIEAGLQFSKDFRLEYGPINELLKLREGIRCGLNAKDISATLMGRYTDKGVNDRLAVLALIDNYLQVVKRPGDYAWIGKERLIEKFNSLSQNVIESLKTKTDIDPTDIHRIAQAGFGLINKTDKTHWDVRKLAAIARKPEILESFLTALPDDPYDADAEILDEAFDTANDALEGQKERDKPDRLLQKALSAVQSIDATNTRVKSVQTQTLLKRLLEACSSLMS